MQPILYSASETAFTSLGLGVLTDAASCIITEERNGMYELEMTYPQGGRHFYDIEEGCYLKAKDATGTNQIFKIYYIKRPIGGIVTICAQHISYELTALTAEPFYAASAALALPELQASIIDNPGYTFTTDILDGRPYQLKIPASGRKVLGGMEGSLIDYYGGELEFNNRSVTLHAARGHDNGVSIRYGKNLMDLTQERNIAAMYAYVYPYYYNTDKDFLLVLPEKRIATGLPGTRTLTLDLTQAFNEVPDEDSLRSAAGAYISSNNLTAPVVSLTVSYAQLSGSEEYKGLAFLEEVKLCDTVTVIFAELGVSASAKVITTKYDVLLDRMDSVVLGNATGSIADTIAAQATEIQKTAHTAQNVSGIIAKAMLGAEGGIVRLLDTNGDGEPDELYIADNADPAQAITVWRWNYEGWAASSNGYDGPYTLGATLDKGFLADAITAAHLTAGTITSADGTTFVLDLTTGSLTMGALQTAQSDIQNLQAAQDKVSQRMDFDPNTGLSIYATNKATNDYYVHITNQSVDIRKVGMADAISSFNTGGVKVEGVVEGTGGFVSGGYKWTHANGLFNLVRA